MNRFRRKTRHFPGGERWRVPRERPVEPVPLPAAGESEPFSRKFPALSPRGGNGRCGQRGLWSRYPGRPRGKVNRFRGKTRHFPGGERWRVPRERPVEPVPLPAAGESEPFSRKFPALSPRGGNGRCGERGLWSQCPCEPRGKVNRFRRKTRHFPGGREWRVPPERPVEPAPLPAAGESEPFSRKSPALSPRVETVSAAREACGAGTPAGCGGK